MYMQVFLWLLQFATKLQEEIHMVMDNPRIVVCLYTMLVWSAIDNIVAPGIDLSLYLSKPVTGLLYGYTCMNETAFVLSLSHNG